MSNETSVPTPAEITKLSFNDSRSQKNQPPYFDPRKTELEKRAYGGDNFSWTAALIIDFILEKEKQNELY